MMPGIYQSLLSYNQKFLRDVALIYYGRNITFRGMLGQTERCARAFLRWGVKQGDHVLLCTAAVPEMVYALLALWKLGAVPHLLNPMFSKDQLALCVERTSASLLLVLDQLFPCISSSTERNTLLQTIVIPVSQSMPFLVRRSEGAKLPLSLVDMDAPRIILWKEFVESGQSICTSPMVSISAKQAACVVYPTQAMGEMNGICLTQGDICTMIDRYRLGGITWERRERFLNMVPVWYPVGIFECLLVPLCLGLTVILESQLHADSFASTLMKEKPHHVAGDKSFWISAMNQPQLVERDLSFLRSAYAGIAHEPFLQGEETAVNAFLQSHHSLAKIHKLN
jgi:acyl-coenzyme A synthetase/AMP-(fatty) acid ligase